MLWTVEHASRVSLQDQIAGCVRRGLAQGDLAAGERLPTAQDLGEALGVDRNTVLAAYRQLRDAGVLEFRRGRGARITDSAVADADAAIEHAARDFIALARTQGYGLAELVRMMEELA